MYLTLLFLPLFVSLITGLFGAKIGRSGTHILACSSIFITTFLSLVIFYEVALNSNPVEIILFK